MSHENRDLHTYKNYHLRQRDYQKCARAINHSPFALRCMEQHPIEPEESLKLISGNKFAHLAGVHWRTPSRWAERGLIEPIKLGRLTRYRLSDVKAFLASNPETKI